MTTYTEIIAWLIKRQNSFEFLRSVNVSVRGSRSPFPRKQLEVMDDFRAAAGS